MTDEEIKQCKRLDHKADLIEFVWRRLFVLLREFAIEYSPEVTEYGEILEVNENGVKRPADLEFWQRMVILMDDGPLGLEERLKKL